MVHNKKISEEFKKLNDSIVNSNKEQLLKEVNKQLFEALEKLVTLDDDFSKFKVAYLKHKKEWEEEYIAYRDYDTQHFIDLACYTRGIQPELAHRLMRDFAIFVLLCKTDKDIEEEAWLWKPKEWWFYFWKYYQIIYKEEECI